MEAKGETLVTNAKTDTLLRPGLGEGMTEMFLGPTGSKTDPLGNPLYADMSGMPPMFLTAGGWEGLQDNADRMAARAKDAGVDVTLEIVPGMQHVFTFQAGRSPEADQTIATIGRAMWRWTVATITFWSTISAMRFSKSLSFVARPMVYIMAWRRGMFACIALVTRTLIVAMV